MRSHYSFSTFFIISLAVQFPRAAQFPDSVNDNKNRRILHQPLFPVNSAPPPPTPPPPPVPDFPDQDQPFSHELPTGPPLDQALQPPPLPATSTPAAHPVATKPSKPTKEVAVAILSAILTLGMLSGVAFYLYKNCEKHCSDESQKLVGENTQRINEESRMPPPPSTFLCVETAEPSRTSLTNENNMRSGSPYRKLKSDRYRPSPEIQPLPPLKKLPPPPPAINSPPPMSSSDDESHENCFYTNKESPNSRQVVNSVPHSKRTSPKSRFSSSSPIKKSLPPSPSPSPPPPATSFGPLQPSKTLPYTPKRTKFSPSPPSDPERSRRSVRNNEHQISKIPIPSPPPPPPPPVAPPPPPPPPPPQSIPTRNGALKTYKFSQVPKQRTRPKSKSPSPEAIPASEKTRNLEEVNKVTSSSEKYDGEDKDGPRSTMKPLHWDKVRAPSDRATVWDQLKSSSFQLNEDAMESLFGRNTVKSVPRPEPTRKKVLPCFELEDRVLDPKKSQNIAILLRALNVTREEVSEALLDGNPEGLGPELFETLVKMAPTKEEEIKLKNYNDESSKLGPAERFLKAILEIPFAFKRVEAMLYTTNFDAEVKYLRKSFQTLEEASEELKNSRLFLKLLEAVLRTGNRMNDGTNRGDAKAFKLDTLLKLVDIKGTDGKTTLLHFVVQEIIRSEGAVSNSTSETQTDKSSFRFNEDDFKKQGLQVVAGLSKELGNVKKAAGMDSDVLSSYVSKLETGLQKVRQVLQYENQSMQGKFFDSMRAFLKEAVDEISRVKAEERKALSMVKEVTLYFHGDAANQEAHPLRIFMIIRDFLAVLDNVCKDVRTMQDRTTLGSGRSFRISATAPLPVLNRYNMPNDRSSDDDSM